MRWKMSSENVNKILDFKISDLCWIFVLEKDLENALENALENEFGKCVGKCAGTPNSYTTKAHEKSKFICTVCCM